MKTIEDFISAGVNPEKILDTTKFPSFIWNVDEMQMISDRGNAYEIVEGENGNKILRVKPGNIGVNAKTYLEFDEFILKQINESDGIVVTETDYAEYFRMAFVGRDAQERNANIENYYKERWAKKA